MKRLDVCSKQREEMIDITNAVNLFLADIGATDGICHLWCPHTTAGLCVNEGADPNVKRDILFALDKIVPSAGYRHAEGNSTAHVKSVLTGSALLLPCQKGRLALGVWQAVYFCEFDGPRDRSVYINLLSANGEK